MKTTRLLPKSVRKALYPWYELAAAAIDVSSTGRARESAELLWLFRAVRPYTMVNGRRLKNLYRLARTLDFMSIPGDIVECGVWNGGTSAVMAYASKDSPMRREMWLFDSFEGITPPTSVDGTKAMVEFYPGWLKGDVEKVRKILDRLSIPRDRAHIVQGWFQDTFPSVHVPRIALLHIDADWYESVKLCLEKFYDALEPGGFVILDDYGYWEGCSSATDEFLDRRQLQVTLVPVEENAFYFQKPPQT